MKFIFPNFRLILAEAAFAFLHVLNYFELVREGTSEDIAAAVIFGILLT